MRYQAARLAMALAAAVGCALGPAFAQGQDAALLAACRANPDLAAVPRAAEIGCACAVDAMAGLTADEKQAIADQGFRPSAFAQIAEPHPELLQAVRDCLQPNED
ncbi:MAG: hypothetical protein ACFCVH_22860 [Alphaproteobacteria bacterium]